MTDYFAPSVLGPRPALPAGFEDWNGYRVPLAPAYEWRGLVDLAHANGFRLTAELLHKWRVWRLLPGPTAGGRRGAGRGKRQTWSPEALERVAWMSRWLAAGLTYDAVRLALWPRTPELELQRPADVSASVARFLLQDEKRHDSLLSPGGPWQKDAALTAYEEAIVIGEPGSQSVARLLTSTGLKEGDPNFSYYREFFRHLTLDKMQTHLSALPAEALQRFITEFRISTAADRETYEEIYWSNALGLTRIVVRRLYRFVLIEKGVIGKPPLVRIPS